MRLWYYKLIPYLPNSQLLAQKRECDLIWKDLHNGKQTNHILINYIWEYKNDYVERLILYYSLLQKEFIRRGFKFKNNSLNLLMANCDGINPFPRHHTSRYLLQCYCNLQEKYDRGQKDFDKDCYKKLATAFMRIMAEKEE